VDPNALETEAQSAIEGAASPDELEQERVRYLGRKSELKQALREVRDRESGMTLNALRERLEAAFAEREEALRGAELEQLLGEESFDVTLPGDESIPSSGRPIARATGIATRPFPTASSTTGPSASRASST